MARASGVSRSEDGDSEKCQAAKEATVSADSKEMRMKIELLNGPCQGSTHYISDVGWEMVDDDKRPLPAFVGIPTETGSGTMYVYKVGKDRKAEYVGVKAAIRHATGKGRYCGR